MANRHNDDFETGLLPYLNLKCVTWGRDSFGLFDYDGLAINEQNLYGYNSFHLYRNENNHECVLSDKILTDHTHMLDVVQNGDKFHIAAGDLKSTNFYKGVAWNVISQYTENCPSLDENNCYKRGHRLREGDVIKIGRYIWKCVEIKTKKDEDENSNFQYSNMPINLFASEELMADKGLLSYHSQDEFSDDGHNREAITKDNKKSCRLCLGDSDSEEDPFLVPCKCSGTMKYIHLTYLKGWIETNKKVKQNQYHTITLFNSVSCELCKQDFPVRIKRKGKIIDILTYKRPKTKNFIVFDTQETESLFEEKIKVYHTFEFKANEEITVGRQYGSHARITDVTISRMHCYLKLYDNSQIWIKDCDSKFGTLSFATKPFTISSENKPLNIQIGRSLVTISFKMPGMCCSKIMIPKPITSGVFYKYSMEDFPEQLAEFFSKKHKKLNDMTMNELNDKIPDTFAEANRSLSSSRKEISIMNVKRPLDLNNNKALKRSSKASKSSSSSQSQFRDWKKSSVSKISSVHDWDEKEIPKTSKIDKNAIRANSKPINMGTTSNENIPDTLDQWERDLDKSKDKTPVQPIDPYGENQVCVNFEEDKYETILHQESMVNKHDTLEDRTPIAQTVKTDEEEEEKLNHHSVHDSFRFSNEDDDEPSKPANIDDDLEIEELFDDFGNRADSEAIDFN